MEKKATKLRADLNSEIDVTKIADVADFLILNFIKRT